MAQYIGAEGWFATFEEACTLLPSLTKTFHSVVLQPTCLTHLQGLPVSCRHVDLPSLVQTNSFVLITRTLKFMVMTNFHSHLFSSRPGLHCQFFTISESSFSYRHLFTIENGVAKVHHSNSAQLILRQVAHFSI